MKDKSTPKDTASKAASTSNGNKTNTKKYKRHITSVKIFIAITVFGLFAFAPSAVAYTILRGHYYITYMYFINHINNPLIYIIFDKKFRSDLKVILLHIWRA